jgi:hypothetical protein
MKDETMMKRNNKEWKGDGKMIKDEVKNEIKRWSPKRNEEVKLSMKSRKKNLNQKENS